MKYDVNIMILGQTGVGKSSLINYLYGSEVVKAGTGKPVTGRNDFQRISVQSPLKPETTVNIFDSWGLESNKAEDWKDVINHKLSSTLSLDDMVYAIVYCISYSNDRIQEFEIAMMKELLAKQYKIIIAFTNADNAGYAQKRAVFREKLKKELPEYIEKYSTVDICVEAKPKLGQSATDSAVFGKEDLFRELEKDVFTNFVKVIYTQWTAWREESRERLKNFRQEGIGRIIEFAGNGKLFQTKMDKALGIHNALEDGLRELAEDIFKKVKDGIKDALALYDHFCGAFFRSERNKAVELRESFGPLIVSIDQAFRFGTKKTKLQTELAKDLDNAVAEIDRKIFDVYGTAEKLFWELGRT